MASKIENELLELTTIRPNREHDRQQHLETLAHATFELDEDNWRRLTRPAQLWYNKASDAIKEEREIPEFPDYQPDAIDNAEEIADLQEAALDEAAQNEDTTDMAKTATAKAAGNGKAAPTRKPARATAPARGATPTRTPVRAATRPARGGADEGPGANALIRGWVIKNPGISNDDLKNKLKAKGKTVSPMTVSTLRSTMLATLRDLNDKGCLAERYARDIKDHIARVKD